MTTTKNRNACKIALATALATSMTAGTAQAQLAGHNVILVHGFQQEDLATPPANLQAIKDAGEDYWQTFWLSRSEARIDWPSDGRVEGTIANVPTSRSVKSVNRDCVMTFASSFRTRPVTWSHAICWKIRLVGCRTKAYHH